MTFGANSVTADQISSRYHETGFVFPLEVMSEEQAADYRHRIESIEARHAASLTVERYIRYDPHYVLPVADELARHPRMLAIAEAVLGPDLLVSNTNIFLKEAHTADFVSWHQDIYYVGLDGLDYLTVWLAITPGWDREWLHALSPWLAPRAVGSPRYLRAGQYADSRPSSGAGGR